MKEQIIHSLRHLYELEKFQISFYMSQLSSTENQYYHNAFTKIVQTEREHASFFARKLAQADIPIPQVGGTLAEIAGSLVGESAEIAGPVNTCKLGVVLENRTLGEYHKLIHAIKGDSVLRDQLMEFVLDEEFHALWLQDYAKRLQRQHDTRLPGRDTEDHPTININMHWL